jgi:hypothetical protein
MDQGGVLDIRVMAKEWQDESGTTEMEVCPVW